MATAFGDLLRQAGVPVSVDQLGRFIRATDMAAPATIDELSVLGRITLVSDRAHLDAYDRVFNQVFRGLVDWADTRGDDNAPPPAHTRPTHDRVTRRHETPRSLEGRREISAGPGGDEDPSGQEIEVAVASPDERLATTDFAELTDDELRDLAQLMREIRLVVPRRLARRHRRHRHGDRLDFRATLRRSRRNGGDPIEQITRRARERPRKLVVLCDILTRALSEANADTALSLAASAAPDWKGGTRIGQALKEWLDRYGRPGMARGAVVVIVSDGWDRDDPDLVAEQMARLARLAHRIVWVNPRRAAPDYAPLAGGMAAALPYCDALVSGNTLVALRDAMRAIADPR